MPKISVIIPMYNAEKYIGLAISSVLAQQFGDFELILINDASTDRTLAIAAGVDDPRVKIINSENNLGGGADRASCAISDWISRAANTSTSWIMTM